MNIIPREPITTRQLCPDFLRIHQTAILNWEWEDMSGRPPFLVGVSVYEPSAYVRYLAVQDKRVLVAVCSRLKVPSGTEQIPNQIMKEEENFVCLFDTWAGLHVCEVKDKRIVVPIKPFFNDILYRSKS